MEIMDSLIRFIRSMSCILYCTLVFKTKYLPLKVEFHKYTYDTYVICYFTLRHSTALQEMNWSSGYLLFADLSWQQQQMSV